ncbi:MAG: type II secretion system F family protein [Actinomycetota bacterium]
MIVVAAAASCVGFVVWFARRARIGARSREAAGPRRRTHAAARAIVAPALTGALVGMFAGGWVLAIAGGVAGAAWRPLRRARDARSRNGRIVAQLPDMLRALAAALRAGRNLPQALEAARDEASAPLRDSLEAAVSLIGVGYSLDEALDALAARAGTQEAALAAETLQIGRAAGANLPAILDVAVESLAERDRIARDRRAASAQAKLSAAVVAAMPVAFFAMVGSGARDQIRILLGDPIGWALLGAGLTLEAGGALWMRALLRPR